MSSNGHFKTFFKVLVKLNISHYSMFQAISQSKMSISQSVFCNRHFTSTPFFNEGWPTAGVVTLAKS